MTYNFAWTESITCCSSAAWSRNDLLQAVQVNSLRNGPGLTVRCLYEAGNNKKWENTHIQREQIPLRANPESPPSKYPTSINNCVQKKDKCIKKSFSAVENRASKAVCTIQNFEASKETNSIDDFHTKTLKIKCRLESLSKFQSNDSRKQENKLPPFDKNLTFEKNKSKIQISIEMLLTILIKR